MSSGCGDVLSLEDLKTAKKHQLFEAEVITGKQGGVAGGSDIDYATNQVTGQTQKTMPAVLRDVGFRPASFTFDTGGTLSVGDADVAVLWPGPGGDGQYYLWRGALPKVIPAASTPATAGGISSTTWVPFGDITLRADLASGDGASLVGTSSGKNVQEEINGINELFGIVIYDYRFTSLQLAVNAAIAINATLVITKSYSLSSQLVVDGNLTIFILNPSTWTFASSVDAVNKGLIESKSGVLKIIGSELTVNASNNLGNGAIISALEKYPQFHNRVTVSGLPNGSAFFASELGVNVNGLAMTGDGVFENLHCDNVKNGVMIYGHDSWWDEFATHESSFRLGDKCVLKATEFSYLMNKLLYAEVGSLLVGDPAGFYKSFSTNLTKDGWVASSATISLNKFTTTGNGGVYTTISGIEIGKTYFLVVGGKTTATSLEFRNGMTGTSPLLGTTTGRVMKFTASSQAIYIRQIGAGTFQLSDFAIFKESTTSSNIFQCASADVNGTRYIGVRRGPVIGIDCKNFTVRGTKAIGVSLTGIDIDIESVSGEPQLYPDAYGGVSDNIIKYTGQRGLYSTARRLTVSDNTFYYAADCDDATTKATMRFNTRNEADTSSQVIVRDNTMLGQNSVSAVSVYRGKVIIGRGNTHDSTSQIPFYVDTAGDDAEGAASITYNSGGAIDIRTLTTADGVVRNGDKISVTDATVTAIRLQSNIFGKSKGMEQTIVRANGNTSTILISVTSGTINGGSNASWANGKQIARAVCISDANDWFVTFESAS